MRESHIVDAESGDVFHPECLELMDPFVEYTLDFTNEFSTWDCSYCCGPLDEPPWEIKSTSTDMGCAHRQVCKRKRNERHY